MPPRKTYVSTTPQMTSAPSQVGTPPPELANASGKTPWVTALIVPPAPRIPISTYGMTKPTRTGNNTQPIR